MHRRRLLSAVLALALVPSALAGVALAAGKPKRGTYIDTKLQVYATTTKDVTAIKSFQAPCLRVAGDAATQSGSMMLSRKIKLNGKGGFSYKGSAKLYFGTPKPAIDKVEIKATYSGGKYKGTVTFPAKYACAVTSFSAKYYGVNPKG